MLVNQSLNTKEILEPALLVEPMVEFAGLRALCGAQVVGHRLMGFGGES